MWPPRLRWFHADLRRPAGPSTGIAGFGRSHQLAQDAATARWHDAGAVAEPHVHRSHQQAHIVEINGVDLDASFSDAYNQHDLRVDASRSGGPLVEPATARADVRQRFAADGDLLVADFHLAERKQPGVNTVTQCTSIQQPRSASNGRGWEPATALPNRCLVRSVLCPREGPLFSGWIAREVSYLGLLTVAGR